MVRRVNNICAIVPVVLSLIALALVVVAYVTGWDRGLSDEGAVAHLFQLLIAAEIPFVAVFLFTTDLKHMARPLAIQLGALLAAFVSVYYLT